MMARAPPAPFEMLVETQAYYAPALVEFGYAWT